MADQAYVTRGEQMLALRRAREASSHPFFRGGFRPFFLGGPLWAVVALALWLGWLSGLVTLPAAVDPLAWHRHEMLFGFVGAAIAGFLLTAIPNWTGRLPIAGSPLAALFALWIAGRLALLFSSVVGLGAAAVLDVGFFAVVGGVAAREILACGNRRNLPVVAMVCAFAAANLLDYLGFSAVIAPDLGWRLALAIIILLISLIGGRIIPSFTRNWMAKQRIAGALPTQPDRFDVAVLLLTAVSLLAWIADGGAFAGAPLLLASAFQAARLARWRGMRTWPDPLVWILHIGYAWVPVGLALLGLADLALAPRSAAIHALSAGAMTTMILAVMSRASLGHTGRELKAVPLVTVAYGLVTLGAVLRVSASLQWLPYDVGLRLGGLAWGGALLLYAVVYAPILWRPRVARAEG
ncbi:MAG TPA: NnrS family protein [Sphingomicrobium sp.]|jgi:uncharacterized protein involved in response to NO